MRALARNDRHVLRGRLRIGPAAHRHTLLANIEESLRLSTLPGEDQGRVYYFRKLHAGPLPENGDRRIWLEVFQHALLELARSAVWGRHADAPEADAIYFTSEQEACGALISRILRKQVTTAWFWPAVAGVEPGASAAAQLTAVIEKLRRSEASWLAVGSAVFASDIPDAVVSIFCLLSGTTVAEWLGEMGVGTTPVVPERIVLPERIHALIERAASLFPNDNEKVLWLATLAVILARPEQMDRGSAPVAALQFLRTKIRADAPVTLPEAPRNPEVVSQTLTHPATQSGANPSDEGFPHNSRASSRRAPTPKTALTGARLVETNPAETEGAETYPVETTLRQTQAAGLYFLLNVLPQVEIPEMPTLAHLFQHIGRNIGIHESDPILDWTYAALEENEPFQPDLRQLRILHWKIRRWCWRNAKISAREIILRPGLVTLTRTDLDVSLSLRLVDIRVRRAGLDLDPGWLPWFGRVVRFHYFAPGELP